MSQESMQVLRMLAEGKITADDANRLLQALNEPFGGADPDPQPAPQASPDPRPAPQPSPDPGANAWTMPFPSAAWSPGDPQQADSPHARATNGGDEARRGGRLDLHQVAAMRAVGVDAAYVRELRDAGLAELAAETLVSMCAVGVDAAYVQAMRDAGLHNLDPSSLTALCAVGVTPEWIAEMRQAGLVDLDVDALVSLRSTGVDAAYIQELGALDLLASESASGQPR